MSAVKILQKIGEQDSVLVPEQYRNWWSEYLRIHRKRYKTLLAFIDEEDKSSKLLDIGCAPGHFTILLKLMGYNIEGVDINPDRMGNLWQKYSISAHKIDVEQEPLPYLDNSIDVAFFAEMLEHLRINPIFTLREIYRILKPGGRMILSTPNITLYLRLLVLLGVSYQGDPVEEFSNLEKLGHMGHIRLYDTKEILHLVKHVGFTVTSYKYKGKPLGGKKALLVSLLCPIPRNRNRLIYVIAHKKITNTT